MFFPAMLSKVKSSLPDLTNTPVLSANTTLEKSTIFMRDNETVVDPHSMSAVSGPCGAQFEFMLAAIAQNLRRLAKLVARPPQVTPKSRWQSLA
jgi:hypothetical protein